MPEPVRKTFLVIGFILFMVPLGAGVYIAAAENSGWPVSVYFYALESVALYPMSLAFLLITSAFVFKIENSWAVRIADLSFLLSLFVAGYLLISSFWTSVHTPYVPLWVALSFAAASILRIRRMRRILNDYDTH